MVKVPSGYVKIAIENGPVEIVSFPIRHGDFPSFFVCLPEGTPEKTVPPPTRSTSKFLHRQRRTRRALLSLRWHHGGEVGLAQGMKPFDVGQLQCWVMWLRF